ncbi:phospholipase [Actinosynnema sp. NPDC020468]|uniref:phospholipase n=1 Tax=Actinosynnema sp. NPDC020468 TaxID=3154488 RepID=UPI0033F0DCD9
MSTTTLRTAVAAVLATTSLLLGATAAHASGDPVAETDEFLFARTLPEFEALWAEKPDADALDWSSDGCSWSPDNPFGYRFLPACRRHDFGYRNYKHQDRFTESARLAIDDLFKADMYGQCGGSWACRRVADVYYRAVRQFGGLRLEGSDVVFGVGA